MNQTVLFTPVGGTDPISLSNCRDGSILQICRHYRPDVVILYMSKEILEKQEQDDRYRYCLKKLAELQNREIQCEIIERPELTEVHDFDYFYEDFRKIISGIYEKIDKTDMLLLNISSGTPAMKSGLLVLQTMGEFPAHLIQVATPERGMNEHMHKGYDVELLWEMDEDNLEDSENRCKEVHCPSLSRLKKEEVIKKHILAYDYKAALDVADTMEKQDTAEYKQLLLMASKRLLLDFSGAKKVSQEMDIQVFPVQSSAEIKYFEYALNMEIRLKKQEYVDFVRAVTPIIVDLFEMILKKECHFVVDQYCRTDGHNRRKWNLETLKGTQAEECLQKEFPKGFNGGDVYSSHLAPLILSFSDDEHLKPLIENIRRVENNLRNVAAHEIISLNDEEIIKMTGFTSAKIMKMIKELFPYAGMRVKKEFWNSYDDMNQIIIQRI